jgi:hypothetical protein
MTARRPSAYLISLQEEQRRAEVTLPGQPDIQPEKQENNKTEIQQDGKTEIQKNSQADNQPARKTGKQQNSRTLRQKPSRAAQERIKATFYLEPEDIMAIDELQMLRFRATGNKPMKSEIVSEAIKLLKQQNSKT